LNDQLAADGAGLSPVPVAADLLGRCDASDDQTSRSDNFIVSIFICSIDRIADYGRPKATD